MDGFEWNKVFAAVLGVAFVFLGLSFLGEALYHPKENDPATVLDLPEAAVTASAGAAPATAEPILALLASADAAAGENVAKKCVACHVFEQGGANKVGPKLYGVLGREIASVPDFGYSGAIKAYAEGGKVWSYEELNGFLWKPKAHIKGTSMGFAGLRKPEERAAIIAWMNTKSDSPLPPPDEAAIAAEAGPAEGEAADGEAKPAAAAEGEGSVTPAANKTGDPNAEGAIVVDPGTPGAVVAPAGENALGEDATGPTDDQAAPADGGTVGQQPVPSVAAPNTIAPKSDADGASLPLAPEAGAPRANAQSDSSGQQGLSPAQVEELNRTQGQPATGGDGAAVTSPASNGAATVTPDAADTAPAARTTTTEGMTTTVPITPARPADDDRLGPAQVFRPKVETPGTD